MIVLQRGVRCEIIIFDDVERDVSDSQYSGVQWCTVWLTVQCCSLLSDDPQFTTSHPSHQSGRTALLTVGVLRSIYQVRTF